MVASNRRYPGAQRFARAVAEKIEATARARGLRAATAPWDAVAEPSDAYMDALDAYVRLGGPERARHLREAAHALLDAWRRAPTSVTCARSS